MPIDRVAPPLANHSQKRAHERQLHMARDSEGKWLLLFPVAILAVFVAPIFLGRTSNCGGNSAALNVCSRFLLTVNLAVEDSGQASLSITNIPAADRPSLARDARNHWISNARFLVTTASIKIAPDAGKRILIVCNTPYSNVPQRRFVRAPATHAVGYSDGTTGLISLAEFEKLDRSSFVPLDELFPTEAETAEPYTIKDFSQQQP